MPKKIEKVKATLRKIDVYFEDGSLLEFKTYENKGAPFLDSVLLYREGEPAAEVIERPPKKQFWSNGTVSKRELAEYWNAALGLAESRFKDYMGERIDDDTWATAGYLWFWIIANEGFETRWILENGQDGLPRDRSPGKDYSLELYRLFVGELGAKPIASDNRKKSWP